MLSDTEIEILYDKYSGELFRYILRFVHSHDNAEDLLQELFLKFIRYSDSRSLDMGNIRALLYSIARSVCLDHSKSEKSKMTTPNSDAINLLADTRQTEERDDLRDFFNKCIDQLPEPERSIMLMRKNGLTFEEIASAIGISLRTAKRKAQKALESIRKEYLSSPFYNNNGIIRDDISLHSKEPI